MINVKVGSYWFFRDGRVVRINYCRKNETRVEVKVLGRPGFFYCKIKELRPLSDLKLLYTLIKWHFTGIHPLTNLK